MDRRERRARGGAGARRAHGTHLGDGLSTARAAIQERAERAPSRARGNAHPGQPDRGCLEAAAQEGEQARADVDPLDAGERLTRPGARDGHRAEGRPEEKIDRHARRDRRLADARAELPGDALAGPAVEGG